MTRKLDASVYYDFTPVMSRNAIFNMIVGGRGIGKSYGAKVREVRRALRSNWQFIYMRRFREELKASAASFFADIAHEFPGWEFKQVGDKALARIAGSDDEWKHIGYFLALSVSKNFTSVSYPNVKTIIFDEFIADPAKIGQKYLNDEWTVLMNFYVTVDRYQERVKVIMLANAISIDNPYFLTLDHVPDGREWYTYKDGMIVIQYPKSEDFNNATMQTRFGKMIADTEYAKFAVNNEFKDAHGRLVVRKSERSRYFYTLVTRKGTFSLWFDTETGNMYAQSKRPKNEEMYTVDPTRISEDSEFLTFSDKKIAHPRTLFRQGKMYFDKPPTRNAFMEIFK